MSKNKKEKEPDVFSYHEALDRSYIITDIIDRILLAHPVIKSHPDIEKKILIAQELIFDVYQELGKLEKTSFSDL